MASNTSHHDTLVQAESSADKEYIVDHLPFQESMELLTNLNPCQEGPMCDMKMAHDVNGVKCRKKFRNKVKHYIYKPPRPKFELPLKSNGCSCFRANTILPSLQKDAEKKTQFHVNLKQAPTSDKIIYNVEYPTRVAIKMEYLMHTTKARINDTEFTDELYASILEDESKDLGLISEAREAAERKRVTKLVIDGKMDPPEDMEYLRHHPVFRVNDLQKQLDQQSKGWTGQPKVTTPITPVEPYEFDGNRFFRHLHQNGNYWVPSEELLAEEEKLRGKIARAKLRLREKRAREADQERVMRILYANSDTKQPSHWTPSQKSEMLADLEKTKEQRNAVFKKRWEKLERIEKERLENVEKRETERDREYLAVEKKRQEIADKYKYKIANKTIIPLLSDESLPVFEEINDDITPPTPPDAEESKSMTYIRRLFNVRGGLGAFEIKNNFVDHYVQNVQNCEEMLDGAEFVSEMFKREQVAADDFMKKLNLSFIQKQ